jgi:hypothetical protein
LLPLPGWAQHFHASLGCHCSAGDVILHGKHDFWGKSGVHYHQVRHSAQQGPARHDMMAGVRLRQLPKTATLQYKQMQLPLCNMLRLWLLRLVCITAAWC